MTWQPSAAILTAGASVPVGYDGAPAWDGGAGCSHGLLAGTRELGEYTKRWLGVASVSGYLCRENTAQPGTTSVHGAGRAADLMHPADGAAVADWLVANAGAIGVQLVIWDHSVWQGSRGSRAFSAYSGPNPHTDHVHVELTRAGAARETAWFQQGASAQAPGARVASVEWKRWLALAVALVALAALADPRGARRVARGLGARVRRLGG